MKLLLGTRNPAKFSEYKKYLIHSDLELASLQDIGFWDEPLEIGKNFLENALQKARFYAQASEYPTLSEDGGFEIDALDGEPGIESRRWAGPYGTDEDRIAKVFKLLQGENSRTARLKFVVVVYFPADRDYVTVEKLIEGVVPQKPSLVRIPEFPYRSVLFLPKFNKYYAELTPDEHEQINHRRAACQELLLKLEPYLSSYAGH